MFDFKAENECDDSIGIGYCSEKTISDLHGKPKKKSSIWNQQHPRRPKSSYEEQSKTIWQTLLHLQF
ncbi:hypothetical protein CHUAL_011167 [Chamberlinius hualienensis]